MSLANAVWRKSSYSGGSGGDCVEVATNLPGIVAIRDSKNPAGHQLIVSSDDWHTFLTNLKALELP